jgi:DNA-binding transcriptional ArsR family regulator
MNKKDKLKAEDLKKLLAKVRIEILSILYQEDTCVCKIVEKTKLKNNLVSNHLKFLIDMLYIEGKKNGLHVIYNLKPSKKVLVKKILSLVEI